MTQIACPQCGETYTIRSDARGRKVKCKACQHVFVATASITVQPASPSMKVDESCHPGAVATRGSSDKRNLPSGAFLLTSNGVLPPPDANAEQRSFLPTLEQGWRNSVQQRRDFLEHNPIGKFLTDPVDNVVPGWYSLAILFDWDAGMDSMYGKQIFRQFLQRIEPNQLRGRVILHFGDLFQTYCGLVVRSECSDDLQAIADVFDSECKIPGLVPHTHRFLYGPVEDGQLIARSFSLPLEAELHHGVFRGDERGGLGRFFTAADAPETLWQWAPPGTIHVGSLSGKAAQKLSGPALIIKPPADPQARLHGAARGMLMAGVLYVLIGSISFVANLFVGSALGVLGALIGLALALFVLYGSLCMRKRQHLELCMASSIVAIIPVCTVVGPLVGVIAISALRNEQVRKLFASDS